MKVMMGVGVSKRGAVAFLTTQGLGAGLEAAVATQAGKQREIGQWTRRSPRSVGILVSCPSVCIALCLVGWPGLQLRCGAAAAGHGGVWGAHGQAEVFGLACCV